MGKPLQLSGTGRKVNLDERADQVAVVETCDAMGWRAAAKGVSGQVLLVG